MLAPASTNRGGEFLSSHREFGKFFACVDGKTATLGQKTHGFFDREIVPAVALLPLLDAEDLLPPSATTEKQTKNDELSVNDAPCHRHWPFDIHSATPKLNQETKQ